MSKANQRKTSAFSQGKKDAKSGCGLRWIRHPHLKEYMAGFNSVMKRKEG